MSDNLENNEKVETKVEEKNSNQKKSIRIRTLIVLLILALFILGSSIIYRASYIETFEIGEEYLEVFSQNVRYKLDIGIINFVIIFIIAYMINNSIKRGLKKFFEEEKINVPKLPNKSIALIFALVTSIIVSNLFLQKVIMFVNSAQFGINDPLYNMDVGFYMFQAPLIGQLLYYALTMLIIFTIYTVVYYIVVFNVFFDGVNRQTLRDSKFIKQLLFDTMLCAIFIAAIILFNMQNIVINGFLTLNDKMETVLIGSGAMDGIKLWGYRILAAVVVFSVYIAIRAFKKNNTKVVIKSLAVVPTYLVMLFVVMFGYNLFFVKGSELDKQKAYINTNINYTKIAYDVNIDTKEIESTGTITEEEKIRNEQIINNIPIITENVAKNNLLKTQTSTGYYTYGKTKASLYNGALVYIAGRELDGNNSTDEYTHGYGAVITSASTTDEAGNVKYVSRDFENTKIKEPRIYYGTQSNASKIISSNIEEFDFPRTATENAGYNYNGDGGVNLSLLDRACVGLKEGNLDLIFAKKNDTILLNRNVIERAEKILPYLMYDEQAYLVISDSGKLYWVIDAYTTSNEFPYSQKTKVIYKNSTKEINYIRNSIKVVVDAFNGDTKFYITDKTDPVAMVYNNMYKNLFEDISELDYGISRYFTYSEFLYNIQSEILTMYHDVSADVLYRGNDVWEIASYSSSISRTGKAEMKPYYTIVKSENGNQSKIGLVIAYNLSERESLNSYLIGTVENGKNVLSLYKFVGDSMVIGPMQLDNLIEQDEAISKEISSLNVTGTKIAKEMIIVPIDNTLLYVVPVYQTSLNEINSVPILKKIVVASGNKVAIGNDLTEAIKNLLSPNDAISIDVEDNSTIDGLIDSIIKANNNLTESNNSNDWGQIGRDIDALQNLIRQLEETKKTEKENNDINNSITNSVNVVD